MFYIYIYIYTHTHTHTHIHGSFNKVNFVYRVCDRKHFSQFHIFFEEINSDEFFHVPEVCQHDLLYWVQKFFFICQHFSTEAPCGKHMISPFIKSLFYENLLFRTHHTYIYKFHMVCTSQPPQIWWQTSVQAWNAMFDLSAFWIASIQIFLWDWFQSKFTIMEKKF